MKHPFFLFLITSTLLWSCGGSENNNKHSGNSWCILLDMSGVREDTLTRRAYSDDMSKILAKLKPGDQFTVSLITESSVTENNYLVNFKLPEFIPSTDNTLIADREKELFDGKNSHRLDSLNTFLKEFILHNDRVSSNTTILDAIHVASLIFKDSASAKKLIIFSDMEEYSELYKFPKEKFNDKRIEEIINAESSGSRGLPDLKGVNIIVAGANSKNSERFYGVRNFWMKYFSKCNATLKEEHYGAAMGNI